MDYDATFKDPWKTQISSGIRFNLDGTANEELPVMFVQYQKPDGTKLARTPISVAALEETNAVFEEYQLKRRFVDHLEDPEIKAKELEKINEEIEYTLYSTDTALYSVVAHLAAEKHVLTDPLDIYRLSSGLSTIALNLPEKFITGIRIKAYQEEEWNRRFMALAKKQ